MYPLFYVTALLLFATGCSGPYSSQTHAARDAQPAATVRAERVRLERIPEIVAATGELFAEENATVSAKVPGRVLKLHVDLGSQARKGEPLAQLEKDDYEFRVRQAEALVEQTRARLGLRDSAGDTVVAEETAIVRQAAANLKEMRFIFGNSSKLAKDGVISNVDFQRAQVNMQASEARYQAALEEVLQLQAQLSERRANLSLARQQLADTLIRAPFDGAVTERKASLGEYLGVNAAVVTLVRLHPLRLRLEVPERLAPKVQIGQRVDVQVAGAARPRQGAVARLSPAIAAQSRSLVMEAEIPNEDAVLRPGSFAEGVIVVDPEARGVGVPAAAVVTFAGVDRAFVVENGALEPRIVRIGRRLAGDRVEILSGLKPGDMLVLEANDRMTGGQKAIVSGS